MIPISQFHHTHESLLSDFRIGFNYLLWSKNMIQDNYIRSHRIIIFTNHIFIHSLGLFIISITEVSMNSAQGNPLGKKKYRRKKKIIRHSNPLFDKWLAEWQAEAEKCGSNMKYNIRRARHSLKLYPLPVYKGKDCKVLAHFGDKICEMLDRKLQKHIDENGPINWDEVHQVMETPVKKKRERKKAAPKTTPVTKRSTGSPASAADTEVTSSGGRRGRAYVPAYRSGAYALLVALYNAVKENNSEFMKKAELMEAAQPLSNSSFLHAADGSHYTAWSSMSTLIKKNLVYKEGSPARYSLTAEGSILAARLLSVTDSNVQSCPFGQSQEVDNPDEVVTLSSRSCSPCSLPNSSIKTISQCQSSTNINARAKKGQTNSAKIKATSSLKSKTNDKKINSANTLNSGSEHLRISAGSLSSSVGSGDLVFSYITNLEMETPLKDRAVVSVEEDGFQGFLIKCRLSSLLSSGLSYRLDDSRTSPLGFTYAYLSDECAPEMCPGLLSPTHRAATNLPKSVSSSRSPFGTNFSSSAEMNSATEDKTCSRNSDSGSTIAVVSSKRVSKTVRALPTLKKSAESVPPLKRVCKEVPSASSPPFTLYPGKYELILCIDNAETKGGFIGSGPTTRDIILSELNKHKIHYDVRKLHVGDFLWILQECNNPQNNTNQPRELVLPYIIERKRMDDLACSIRDGRFKEQKFRLKQSGLSKPIYLVEEYGSQHVRLPEANCLQAITNTQIVDGFTVKVTKDQQESAAFLTIMTRCLQSRYQGKSVSSLPIEVLQSQSSDSSNCDVETELVSFKEFNSSSMKNRQLPVKEMFAKHLLQCHGLSVDKAKAIVEKYGTPASLLSAYEEIQNPVEWEQMLASLKCGKTGRSLGPALSSTISKLYNNLTLQ